MLIDALTQFSPIVLAVWGLTELVGQRTLWPKDLIAIVVGPILAVGDFYVGGLPAVSTWYAALFVGFVSTLSAGVFADYIASPLMKRFRRGDAVHSTEDKTPKT